ncbi:hypothetical protein I315_02908 [Cryptococcus gattii Ru294]|nr:hypothetical protein I315_02908 [Cryptococcus gattii Ru294]
MWALSLLYRYEIPLAVAGVVAVRWLPGLISSPRPALPVRQPLPPCAGAAKCLLVVSSLYHLYRLVFPPYDLFIHNNLDILAQNTLLRDALRQSLRSSTGDYSPVEDLLLTRLKVLDNRYLYARLGHRPMLECLWCTHALDYFLFALPSILWPYVCEALVLGVLGWRVVGGGPGAERRTERWRGVMAWTLFGAAVAEIGVKWAWEVVAVQGDCAHVAPAIHTIRSLFLLLLPIVYVLLPVASPSPSPSPSASAIMPYLTSLQSTLHYTSVTRAAIRQSPQLRTAVQAVNKREGEDAEKARRDDAVWARASEAGLDEDGIRRQVRVMLKNGWERLMRLGEL